VRRLLIVGCGLVVLAAIAAGVAISSRLVPERCGRASAPREVVGPVEIDVVRPTSPGHRAELEGLRVRRAKPGPAAKNVRSRSPRAACCGEPLARRVDARTQRGA
jgi:hypothetical protein